VRVADWIISNRGMGRNSVIAGRSVHNQRIERLWRDVRVNVIDFYRTIFYEFAHQLVSISLMILLCTAYITYLWE